MPYLIHRRASNAVLCTAEDYSRLHSYNYLYNILKGFYCKLNYSILYLVCNYLLTSLGV